MPISFRTDWNPDRTAVIMGGSGKVITYGELEAASVRLSGALRAAGLKTGDHIAILMENNEHYFEVCWAAQRMGLYYTPINWHLAQNEAAYIIGNCGARAVITSVFLGELATEVMADISEDVRRFVMGGDLAGFENLSLMAAGQSDEPAGEELDGQIMFYSSGTTGLPKGVKITLTGNPFGTPTALGEVIPKMYGIDDRSIYLSPAPLYHAAPLYYCMSVHGSGGAVVVMENFDPEDCLQLIEQHKVSHAQFVPTMFVRMLKLPEEIRAKYEVSSLKVGIHAAAPCPIDVKEQMIDWWGPVLVEYYAGSERNGMTMITSPDWLQHKGSVGRAIYGKVRIQGEDGETLPPGENGTIYMGETEPFEYHNDPEKTASSRHDDGWSTLGDVGYLDEDGYLYLTDRKAHMIISGGVNIYPQETENALVLHPVVRDVAVIGVPNPEMGEEVKAVVQLMDPSAASEALGEELMAFCRERIAHFKCPRSVDFIEDFPRLPNGKLMKRQLRERYWGDGKKI